MTVTDKLAVEADKTAASSDTAPVFLVGAERSGTTLLRLMLDHHPHVSFHFEFEFAVDLVGKDGELPPLAAYHDYLSQHRVFQLSGARIDAGLEYRQLVDSFLRQFQQVHGGSVLGATVHRHFDRLLFLWPEARFLHLIRDGRDVARSMIAMGWAGNLWSAVDRWIDAERTWENMCQRVPAARRLDVYYEELLTDTEPTLSKICRFLGVEYDRAMLDYPKSTTYAPPDPTMIHQWRKLPHRQVALAEVKAGRLLAQRGYELSQGDPIQPTLPTRAWLRLHDKWRRAAFRGKRYGLKLHLSEILARRLGSKSWARSCQSAMDAIDNQHLH